jgi:hypothetical protein
MPHHFPAYPVFCVVRRGGRDQALQLDNQLFNPDRLMIADSIAKPPQPVNRFTRQAGGGGSMTGLLVNINPRRLDQPFETLALIA